VGDRIRNFPRRILLATVAIAIGLFSFPAPAQTKASPKPDADCLACHSQKDLKSASGRSVYVDETKHSAGAHSILNCTDCHTNIKEFPHPARIAKVNCATCHAEEAVDVPKSVHSLFGAQACNCCHGSAHDAQPAAGLVPKLCASCHNDEVQGFLASVHATAARNGDRQAPSCQTCHGSVHKILTGQDPASPVAKKNLPDTCGSCHSNPSFLAQHQIPFARPVEAYRLSVHGRAVAAGNQNAAACSDCHGSHEIYAARDPHSKVNHWNVPATCGTCHREIEKTYLASVHGQAVAAGATDAPVCTDCHGEHIILAPSETQSFVNPSRVSTVTCGRCHADERLDARYNLPADRVSTFADSFHGLASRAGSQTVANCASCHGVHNIFAPSDPRSTVNLANLAHTCGGCHPGAGQTFAIGPVHVRSQGHTEHPVVRTIRWAYWILIPLTLGFMFLHNLLDFLRKLLRIEPRIDPGEEVKRMNFHFRMAHWLTVISFPVLVITGFALKFPEAWWARPMQLWEHHFAFRGTVHRVAAVVLLASLGYHVMHLILVRRDRVILRYLTPDLGDLRNLGGMFLYNLGLSGTRPRFGAFSYAEKMEYWAFLWGTMLMAASGFILWFNNFALRHFPKWVTDAATALHFYEAILATFSILIWHMYMVVFDPDVYPMDRAWLTGKTSADHLRHTRPAYYAELVNQTKSETLLPETEATREESRETEGSDKRHDPKGPGASA
jgi:cytochrome b subunit of formate dehydrogenase